MSLIWAAPMYKEMVSYKAKTDELLKKAEATKPRRREATALIHQGQAALRALVRFPRASDSGGETAAVGG